MKNEMKKIASFTVDHDKLKKGMYISRIDGDVVTYDIRMKIPNGGEYLSATYARNSRFSAEVLYVGPMGCRTGFYLLLRDGVRGDEAIGLVKESMRFIRGFEGEIPGNKRKECGNYLDHDLAEAKAVAADMCGVLADWTENRLKSEE